MRFTEIRCLFSRILPLSIGITLYTPYELMNHQEELSDKRRSSVARICSSSPQEKTSVPALGVAIHDRMFQHTKSALFPSCSVIRLSNQSIRRQKQTLQRFFSSAALSVETVAIMEFRSANFKGTEIHVHDTDNDETVNVHYFLGGKTIYMPESRCQQL
jgi:hypothetical protein